METQLFEKEQIEQPQQEFIFKPNPGPQENFLAAAEQEVLYGGAAGGGKSYSLVADPVRYFENSAFRGLLLRRTTEELRELINISHKLYPALFGDNIHWVERDKTWYHKSGSSFWMSYLERDQDVMRYQGQAFSWIGFDELTQWSSPYAWNYLRSRLRTTSTSGLALCMRACVDEGDVLTETGWKDIRLVKEGDKVFSVDVSGSLVLRPVTKFHEYHVSEKLVRVRKKNMYMSMTPDHRVVYEKYGSNTPHLVKFNEHEGKSIAVLRSPRYYKNSAEYQTPLLFDKDGYAEFLGLYIAEGSINQNPKNGNYKVVVTQNKEKNHQFVRRVMESSGAKVCYSKNGDFQITNKELWSWMKPLGKSHEKHFPREFLDKANRHQLTLAFNAYALGDGHWQSSKSVSLFTTSDQLADDLQEICVKLGYKTTRSYQVLDNPDHKNRWVIYVTLREPTTKIDKNLSGRNDVSYEDYVGKVYCLSVAETENFVLRQKGCVWVSGNTSNPGGPGHSWVKKMFVDPAPPGKSFWATDIETGEVLTWPEGHSKAGKPLFKRKFIPATLFDNPYLAQDGNYEANLLSLPENERKRLLYGDWDVAEGAAFSEWNRKIHVIEPFEIPQNWMRFRACDYGYGSFAFVIWFAVDPATEQLIVYREMKVKKVLAVDLADMIVNAESDERIRYGVLDSSLWHKRGDTGPSLAEQMIARGCRWRPSDRSAGSRIAGKNEIHRRLQVDSFTEEPRIVFFSTCTNIISEIPSIPLDKNNPEDVDTGVDDHGYDALRYGVMSRPRGYTFDNDPFASITPETTFDTTFGY